MSLNLESLAGIKERGKLIKKLQELMRKEGIAYIVRATVSTYTSLLRELASELNCRCNVDDVVTKLSVTLNIILTMAHEKNSYELLNIALRLMNDGLEAISKLKNNPSDCISIDELSKKVNEYIEIADKVRD